MAAGPLPGSGLEGGGLGCEQGRVPAFKGVPHTPISNVARLHGHPCNIGDKGTPMVPEEATQIGCLRARGWFRAHGSGKPRRAARRLPGPDLVPAQRLRMPTRRSFLPAAHGQLLLARNSCPQRGRHQDDAVPTQEKIRQHPLVCLQSSGRGGWNKAHDNRHHPCSAWAQGRAPTWCIGLLLPIPPPPAAPAALTRMISSNVSSSMSTVVTTSSTSPRIMFKCWS